MAKQAKVRCPSCRALRDVTVVSKTAKKMKVKCKKCRTVFVTSPVAKKKAAKKEVRKRTTAIDKVRGAALPPDKKPQPPLKNPQHEKFCACIIGSSNLTEAAIKAGYSERSAGQIAHELMKKHEIVARVDTLLARMTHGLVTDQRQNLITLVQQARGSAADYMRVGEEGQSFIEFGPDMPNPQAVKKITTRIEIDDEGKRHAFINALELHDQRRAIADMEQMLGRKKDKTEISGSLVMIPANVNAKPKKDPK